MRKLRRFDEAEQAGLVAISIRPEDVSLYVELGSVFADNQRYSMALSWFEKGREIDPKKLECWRAALSVLRSTRKFAEAHALGEKAIEVLSDEPSILVEMSQLYDDQLMFDEALHWSNRALTIDPRSVTAATARSSTLRSFRRFDEAEEGLQAVRVLLPRERALQAELGWVYYDGGKFEESRQLFLELRQSSCSPDEEAECGGRLGWIEFALGNYVEAEVLFEGACRQAPTQTQLVLGFAWTLTRKKGADYKRASRACFDVLKIDPMNCLAYVCLGVISYELRRFLESEGYLKKAILLDSHRGSYVDLGALYAQLGRLPEAEESLLKSLSLDWYDAQAHVELGFVYVSLVLEGSNEHLRDAIRHFRQAIKIDPASGNATLGLVFSLVQGPGDFVEAEAILRKALSRKCCDQPRWKLLLALSQLLIQRGDLTHSQLHYTEALACAQEAVQLAASEPEPYLASAIARFKRAEAGIDLPARTIARRRALKDLRRCIELDPGQTEARRSLQIIEEGSGGQGPGNLASGVVVVVSIAVLVGLWVGFLALNKITATSVIILTPVLVGLLLIGLLLPLVTRVKLPGGVEADLAGSIRQISAGPTGEDAFGPGRFGVSPISIGPRGKIPRLK